MRALFAVLLVVLAGCATPYQAKGIRGGYSDRVLDEKDGLFEVTFAGNTYSNRADVLTYAKRRAAELCQERGFKGWEQRNQEDKCAELVTLGPSCEQAKVVLIIRCTK